MFKSKLNGDRDKSAPYCQCWYKRNPEPWKQQVPCSCGEDADALHEWKWGEPDASVASWVIITDDEKQVNFHPFYSSGTAAVKGSAPMVHNYHYYWEVKMLTDTYGTDIMVGVGTDKVNISDSQHKFTSFLGQDGESYGLSYTGAVRHNGTVSRDTSGFCRGSIVGVRLDMWTGTLEFYINRKPQGVSFFNLRRHQALYPMMCSTAAQSSLRLLYAASWPSTLLAAAARALGAAALPPGLRLALRRHPWLTMPTKCNSLNKDEEDPAREELVKMAASGPSELLPSSYENGFYMDNVDRNYRIMVWE